MLSELEGSGLLVPSEGAKVVFLDGSRKSVTAAEDDTSRSDVPPMLLEKKDGGYLYATTDAAALRQRLVQDKYDWLVYITDNSQNGHFSQLFQVVLDALQRASTDRP